MIGRSAPAHDSILEHSLNFPRSKTVRRLCHFRRCDGPCGMCGLLWSFSESWQHSRMTDFEAKAACILFLDRREERTRVDRGGGFRVLLGNHDYQSKAPG